MPTIRFPSILYSGSTSLTVTLFSGNAGQQIAIRMQSEDFDTALFLRGPDGQFVGASFDCQGDGTNSCIPFDTLQGGRLSLPSTGTYTIEATTSSIGATGSYSLTVSEEE